MMKIKLSIGLSLLIGIYVIFYYNSYQQKLSNENLSSVALDFIVSSKTSKLPRECMNILEIKRESNTATFEVREVHNAVCGGDPNSAPLVAIVGVNIETNVASIEALE